MCAGVWPSTFLNLSRRETRVRPCGVGVRLWGTDTRFHLPLGREVIEGHSLIIWGKN